MTVSVQDGEVPAIGHLDRTFTGQAVNMSLQSRSEVLAEYSPCMVEGAIGDVEIQCRGCLPNDGPRVRLPLRVSEDARQPFVGRTENLRPLDRVMDTELGIRANSDRVKTVREFWDVVGIGGGYEVAIIVLECANDAVSTGPRSYENESDRVVGSSSE